MTTIIKPGNHPDADQLSAFIEQALPAHERDGVLVHLAVCPDCRAVVALALPEAPAAVAVPEPRRSSIGKSWFSNWMIFLPAATAVAALALFIFFIHRHAPVTQQQAQITPAPAAGAPVSATPPAQLESRSLPKAASPAPRAEIATPGGPSPTRPLAASQNTAMGSAGAMQAATGQLADNKSEVGQNVVTENQSIQSAPAQNTVNSFAPESINGVVSQNQSSNQAATPRSTFHSGAVSGTLRSNQSYQQADANTQNRQQQDGLQQTASQTVQVQAEATPVETESAELHGVIAGRAVSNLSFVRQPVPSGLPLLSSAAQGAIVLAIDTHHAVFVSGDSGQHWKTVRTAWKGRAVLVEATASAKLVALPAAAASLESIAGMSQGAVLAKKAGAVLTGTVTDPSGAVVSGATVTVTDPRNKLTRTITTDVNGRYVATGLEPGKYELDATAQGFMRSHLSDIAVTDSKENIANFTLRVGTAAETVTVEASQPSIEVENDSELKTVPRARAAASEKVRQASPAVFEIVTDKGAHWTSADGLTWQPK